MNIHELVKMVGDVSRRGRSEYHLTLSQAIKISASCPPNALVLFADGGAPGRERSYRGFYDDLAFESTKEDVTCAAFNKACTEALGKTYEGYKGGDFVMDERTPLWRADYGYCGDAIVSAHIDSSGNLILTCKPESDE